MPGHPERGGPADPGRVSLLGPGMREAVLTGCLQQGEQQRLACARAQEAAAREGNAFPFLAG